MIRKFTIGILLTALFALSALAQAPVEYEQFLADAVKEFGARSTKFDKEYAIADFDNWDYLQADGQLRFSKGGVTKVVANAQLLGSFSTYSDTWMWSWANSTVDSAVKKDIGKVREFGRAKGYRELIEPKFASDEDHAWKLVAASAQIVGAKSAFRGRIEDGWVYFLITDIRRLDK